jgi:hypothetical protein
MPMEPTDKRLQAFGATNSEEITAKENGDNFKKQRSLQPNQLLKIAKQSHNLQATQIFTIECVKRSV